MRMIMKQISLKRCYRNVIRMLSGCIIVLWSIDLIRIIFFNYQLSKLSMIVDTVLIISYFIRDFLDKD